MSLKAFHILFVVVSVVLALGFATWAYTEFRRTGDREFVWWAFASLLAASGLMVYGRWFLNKLKGPYLIAVSALLVGLAAQPTKACSTCFGDPDSAMVKGAVMGVYVLAGVVGFVLAGIAGTGLYWMQRARRLSRAGDDAMLSEAKHLAATAPGSSVAEATSE
jgi:hypothetical protein